jgi:hypothetical protein
MTPRTSRGPGSQPDHDVHTAYPFTRVPRIMTPALRRCLRATTRPGTYVFAEHGTHADDLDVTGRLPGRARLRHGNDGAVSNMTDDVKRMAMDTEESIRSGKFHPFKCPVMDQDRKTVECKGGGRLSNEQILSMNWYVKGFDDKIPSK